MESRREWSRTAVLCVLPSIEGPSDRPPRAGPSDAQRGLLFRSTAKCAAAEQVHRLTVWWKDGHRELLAVTIGAEEFETSWSELLSRLIDRGLSSVRLLIADHHRGLTNAARSQLSKARPALLPKGARVALDPRGERIAYVVGSTLTVAKLSGKAIATAEVPADVEVGQVELRRDGERTTTSDCQASRRVRAREAQTESGCASASADSHAERAERG